MFIGCCGTRFSLRVDTELIKNFTAFMEAENYDLVYKISPLDHQLNKLNRA
jgi:hypothetical protein